MLNTVLLSQPVYGSLKENEDKQLHEAAILIPSHKNLRITNCKSYVISTNICL